MIENTSNLYWFCQDDILSVAGRTWLGKLFCEKIVNHGKGNKKYFEKEEVQRTLE